MLIETSADFKYTFSNNSQKNLINCLNTPNQNKNITIKSLGIYIQPKPLHCSPYPALEKEERKINKKKKKRYLIKNTKAIWNLI
jgi:hypothetical protein